MAKKWYKKRISTKWRIAIIGFLLLSVALLIPVVKNSQNINSDAATNIYSCNNTGGSCMLRGICRGERPYYDEDTRSNSLCRTRFHNNSYVCCTPKIATPTSNPKNSPTPMPNYSLLNKYCLMSDKKPIDVYVYCKKDVYYATTAYVNRNRAECDRRGIPVKVVVSDRQVKNGEIINGHRVIQWAYISSNCPAH